MEDRMKNDWGNIKNRGKYILKSRRGGNNVMVNQDAARSMVGILEGQIKELNEDLENVKHRVTKHAIKDGIKTLEESLTNAKQKLN